MLIGLCSSSATVANVLSFKKFYAGSRAKDIKVYIKCANVTKR